MLATEWTCFLLVRFLQSGILSLNLIFPHPCPHASVCSETLSTLMLSSNCGILKVLNLHLIIQSIGLFLRYFQLRKRPVNRIVKQKTDILFYSDIKVDFTNKILSTICLPAATLILWQINKLYSHFNGSVLLDKSANIFEFHE